MSVINQAAHNVVTYIAAGSNKTLAFSGQRLATITYKTVTDKNSALYNIKPESKAVSLPLITDDEITGALPALLPHIKNMLNGVQDKIIREKLDNEGKVSFIRNDEIDMVAMCEYLDSSNESGRLTKESVAAWFDVSIADMLTVTLADKLGVSDTPSEAETKHISAIVAGFKDKIAALAGGKTAYEPKLCTSIKKCLALADGDVMATRFIARLDKMIADSKATEGMLDLL